MDELRLPAVIHLRYSIKTFYYSTDSHPPDMLQEITEREDRRAELLGLTYGSHYDIKKDEYVIVPDGNSSIVWHHLIAVRKDETESTGTEVRGDDRFVWKGLDEDIIPGYVERQPEPDPDQLEGRAREVAILRRAKGRQ